MNEYENILDEYKKIALSNTEVLKLLNGKANIILYPQLINVQKIDEILDPYGACIILFESKPNFGHWCCLFKLNNYELEFFNPYGGYPDDSLKFINKQFSKITNQDFPYLSELMIESPYKLSYNQHKFQKMENNINTCGRWCSLRVHYRNFSLNKFYNFIKYWKKKLDLKNDDLVTLFTMWIN